MEGTGQSPYRMQLLLLHYSNVPSTDAQQTVQVSTLANGNKQRKELTSNNPIDRDINTRRITRRIAQQIHIRTSQLLHLCQPPEPSIVVQLLLPVLLLWYPVGHGGVDETRRDTVDADVVGSPFHGEGVCHVANAGLRGAIGGRWDSLVFISGCSDPVSGKRYLVRSIRCHGCRKDNRPFNPQPNKRSRGSPGRVERAKQLPQSPTATGLNKRLKTYIHRKQSLDLLIRELQRRLMLSPSRIRNNPMQRPGLFNDPIHGCRDT